MHPPARKAVSFWSAVSLGIGAMVGAGIFALLGQAGAMAGSAVYLSFLLGGGIALLSGYSMAKLGARYPSAGGIVEYLVQCFGVGFFSGWMSVVLYVAALVALSMIARAFGSYAAALVSHGESTLLVSTLSIAVTFLLVVINLGGAEAMAKVDAVTNVTYQMAKNGELPEFFGKPIVHSREGLVVSGCIVMVLSALLDVGDIATIGALLILLVHCAVHIGHLGRTSKTGASRPVVALAALATGSAVLSAGYHAVTNNPKLIVVSLAFIGATIIAELVLRSSRTIRQRAP